MANIYTVDKGNTLAQEAGLARDLDRLMGRIVQYKAWIDTQTDQDLIDSGFIQAEVNLLRSAISDLILLETIYVGTATQSSLKDFRTFAKQLYPYGSI